MLRRTDEGQAATELALVLPVLVLLLLAVVQVTLVARDQVLVVHAAREAARQAAVDPRPSSIRAAARRAAPGLKPGRLGTDSGQTGGAPVTVTVRVVYRVPTDLALIGPLLPDVEVEAKAAMRREPAGGLWKTSTEGQQSGRNAPVGGEPSGREMGSGPPH